MKISEENQMWLNWVYKNTELRLVIEIGSKRIVAKLIILKYHRPKTITFKGTNDLDSLITEVKNEFGLYNLAQKIGGL